VQFVLDSEAIYLKTETVILKHCILKLVRNQKGA